MAAWGSAIVLLGAGLFLQTASDTSDTIDTLALLGTPGPSGSATFLVGAEISSKLRLTPLTPLTPWRS